MPLAALAFAAGAALLQQQAELPALGSVGLLPLLAGLAWLRPKWAFIFTFGIGFLWAAGWAHWRMMDRLALELEGRDLDVVGVVASLPAIGDRGLRFEFDVESVEGGARLPARLLVSWYRSPSYEDAPAALSDSVHPGERWLFTLRLRPPHGLVNPHSCVALLPRFPRRDEEGGTPPPEPSGVPLFPPALLRGIGGASKRLSSTSPSETTIGW